MTSYYILSLNGPNYKLHIEKNIFSYGGEQFVPITYDSNDKYILLERTIMEDQTEFFSNAWSSSDLENIQATCYSKDHYIDHINGSTAGVKPNEDPYPITYVQPTFNPN